MADVAVVTCGINNGLVLEVSRATPEEPFAVERVKLASGINRIDGAFWTDWLAQNAEYPPLLTGQVGGYIET